MFVQRKHTSKSTQRTISIVGFGIVTLLLIASFVSDFALKSNRINGKQILDVRRTNLSHQPVDKELFINFQNDRAQSRAERRISKRNKPVIVDKHLKTEISESNSHQLEPRNVKQSEDEQTTKSAGVPGFTHSSLSANEIVAEEKIREEADSFSFLLVLILLIICFLTAFALRSTQFPYLHEAGAAILFGLIVGAGIRFVTDVDQLKRVVVFDREVFFLFLLPPIIFSGGFNLQKRAFFDNIGSILLLAFLGTTFSAFLVGGIVYGCVSAGIIAEPLSLMESLLFGSLISATDPVTVLSIFGMLGVNVNLYSNVFGESVLNDAVAIVLYGAVLTFEDKALDFGGFMGAIGGFVLIFAGSLASGVAIGFLSSLLFKYADMHKFPILESALLMTYAYSSYLFAQGLNLSGIVSILFCGMVMAHYTLRNLSWDSQAVVAQVFEIISLLAETFVFVYLGLAIFSFSQEYSFSMIIVSILACLIGRIHVFPILWFVNKFRKNVRDKSTTADMVVVWLSGLRGAIAFSLALGKETTNGEVIFTTTLIIVLFTVLIMGGATVPVLEKLRIRKDGSHLLTMSPDDIALAEARRASSWIMTLDRRWLQPFFTRRRGGYGTTTQAVEHLVQMDLLEDDDDDDLVFDDVEGGLPMVQEPLEELKTN